MFTKDNIAIYLIIYLNKNCKIRLLQLFVSLPILIILEEYCEPILTLQSATYIYIYNLENPDNTTFKAFFLEIVSKTKRLASIRTGTNLLTAPQWRLGAGCIIIAMAINQLTYTKPFILNPISTSKTVSRTLEQRVLQWDTFILEKFPL